MTPLRKSLRPYRGKQMSILIDQDTKIIVQGLTGKTGTFHTEQALAYHSTKMVAGTHPKKGGTDWTGANGATLPIFSNVTEAKDETAQRPASFMSRLQAQQPQSKKLLTPRLISLPASLKACLSRIWCA